MTKKILFVSPTGTLDNGAEQSMVQLMIALTQKGHAVYNVYPENGHATHEQYAQIMASNHIQTFPIKTLKWWWEEAPGELRGDAEDRSLFYHHNIFEIRQIIQQHQIDVVITNTANMFQGAIAAACQKVMHLWFLHEFPDGEFAYYSDKIKFIEQFSDAIFTVEGHLYQKLQTLLLDVNKLKPFVPYSPIEAIDLSEIAQTRLVAVGKINENKNQLSLLEAYKNSEYVNTELLLIGGWDEAYKQKCEAYIQAHHLEHVTFLGHVACPWQYVGKNDVCVLTSKSESFSLVYTEALLMGLPTIVSDNLGYQSASAFFDVSENSYALENTTELTKMINDYLKNIVVQQNKFSQFKQQAKRRYHSEQCYALVLETLDKAPVTSVKTLESIHYLLGRSKLDEQLIERYSQHIKIYYANANQEFSEQRVLTYGMEKCGELQFTFPVDVEQIRLDLSEKQGVYTVELLDSKDESLRPCAIFGGIVEDNVYILYRDDPQLIYHLQGASYPVRLIYKRMDKHDLASTLFTTVQKMQDEQFNMQHKLQVTKQEYEQLYEQYQAIKQTIWYKLFSKCQNMLKKYRRK